MNSKGERCSRLGVTKVSAIVLIFALSAIIQINPQRAYGLTNGRASVTGVVAKPGQNVTFEILLNYTASQPVSSITYSLEAQGLPEGWIPRFYYGGQEITSLTIANFNPSVPPPIVDLKIEIPKNETPGHYSFTFLAMGKELQTEDLLLGLTIDVEALRREIKLSTEFPDVTVELGGTAKFTIVLDNIGETDELANLTAELPEGWGLTFTGKPGGIFGVAVPQGQSTIIDVEAKPPEGVAPGVYDIKIRAKSADQVANSMLQLKVAVIKVGIAERTISTLYPEIDVEGVINVFFPITIRNLGTSSLTYRLSQLSVPPGWIVSFRTTPDTTASSVSSIYLVGGDSAILYLEAEPPATVTIGTYAFTIRVTSEEGSSQDLTVTAKLIGSYEVTMELDSLYRQIRAGETSTTMARVTNTGASKLMNVSLEVSAPSDWEVTKTPNYIDTLNPGDFTTITLFLKAPSTADIGDYLIGVRTTSDRAKSTQILLRVNVQSPSLSLWIIGIASIAIAVIAVVLVYLKFGRKR